MAKSDAIVKAVGEHGLWKFLLRDAIKNGHSDFSPETVRRDDLCNFGKWLLALPPSDKKSAHWKKIQSLHAAFHKNAAEVLDLALKGETAEAGKAMKSASPYSTTSANLIAAMMVWLDKE